MADSPPARLGAAEREREPLAVRGRQLSAVALLGGGAGVHDRLRRGAGESVIKYTTRTAHSEAPIVKGTGYDVD